MGQKDYSLQWLDLVITVTFNPLKTQMGLLSRLQTDILISEAKIQTEKIQYLLKGHFLAVHSQAKSKRIVRRYYLALSRLLNTAQQYAPFLTDAPENVHTAYLSVIECVCELLTFIEDCFGAFITGDDPVPEMYLARMQREIESRVYPCKESISACLQDKLLSEIVFHALDSFVNGNYGRVITFKEADYKKELINALEKTAFLKDKVKMKDELIKQLVYLNFNSRAFINYFTDHILAQVNGFEQLTDQISELLNCSKQFNLLHSKTGVCLNPNYPPLKQIIVSWFKNEMAYLEKKQQLALARPASIQTHCVDEVKSEPFKLICFLSADQIAIILRALDSLRIIKARSMSLVFKSIAPFLSTPRVQDISWESMRSKAYNVEESDKEAVIKTLESVIEWVKQ